MELGGLNVQINADISALLKALERGEREIDKLITNLETKKISISDEGMKKTIETLQKVVMYSDSAFVNMERAIKKYTDRIEHSKDKTKETLKVFQTFEDFSTKFLTNVDKARAQVNRMERGDINTPKGMKKTGETSISDIMEQFKGTGNKEYLDALSNGASQTSIYF